MIIGIIVYLNSAIFLNVYSIATSTLFFCVLYDLEMSKDDARITTSNRLEEILSKSNDFQKDKFPTISEQSTSDRTQSRF